MWQCSQYGFQKGRFTIHAISKLVSIAQEIVSQGGMTLAVQIPETLIQERWQDTVLPRI